MTQPSEGQRRQQMIDRIDDLIRDAERVEWHDANEVRDFIITLMHTLKG
jgi:hypothetical protein